MDYYLFFDGSKYDSRKYSSIEEAKAAAEKYNGDQEIARRFGLVYVADKYGDFVC